MEHAMQYAIEMIWKNNEVLEINQIRLCKQALIPGELVGMNSQNTTSCYQIINEKSQIRQKF